MAHVEIAAALTTFAGLVVVWFAVPSASPAAAPASLSNADSAHDVIPSAA
jgi:hypothetical protein